jgi:hypothetical protein
MRKTKPRVKDPAPRTIYKKRAAKPEPDRVPMKPGMRLKGRNKLRGLI